MRALITGATGFIGRRLVEKLPGCVVLTRDPEAAKRALGDVEAHRWEPSQGPPPEAALAGVEVVFHLAGESVAGRWTKEHKRQIRDSRVVGTRNLVAAMVARRERPGVLVAGSAVGFYGARGDEILDETATVGSDFLADVCREWEGESARARDAGVRVALVRTGIVLGRNGGPLAKMVTPFKMGVGGRLGDGKQWMPWIHVDDEVGLLLHAAKSAAVDGVMNGVAPTSVTNREFTRALGAVLSRPTILPAPAFALRLVLGEFAGAVLGSQRVVPRVAERTGYRFAWPEIEAALRDCLGKSPSASTPPSGIASA